MTTNTGDRVQEFASLLGQNGVSAYFAHDPVTIGYLTGFSEGAGERFMVFAVNQSGQTRLICPALSVNQATRAGISDIRALMDGEDPNGPLTSLVSELGVSGTVAVDDTMPAAQLLLIQSLMPGVRFIAGSPIAARMMRFKQKSELDSLFTTGGFADRAYEGIVGFVKPGLTEEAVAMRLSDLMAASGGRPSFGIVATGANGAEPHHHTDSSVIQAGDVLIMDFGCTVDGYFSDITRTVAVGSASEKAKEVYSVVYEAHMAARAAIGPGVTAGSIDAAARGVIEAAGYGEFFTHRTGHGLGLKIHEEPYIMPGSEVVLEAGDCFSIEPGIYLPGEFGVRIENIVTVTEGGHASFNADPPSELPVV